MTKFEAFEQIIRMLRSPGGCPWDREQTHESLKPACIEEAAELLGAINMYARTGNAANMKEELGDLLLQVVMHAVIAEEEGLFTMDEVIDTVSEKMIRRHPHVFGNKTDSVSGIEGAETIKTSSESIEPTCKTSLWEEKVKDVEEIMENWEEIKKKEKSGKEENLSILAEAFDEAEELIGRARKRKGISG